MTVASHFADPDGDSSANAPEYDDRRIVPDWQSVRHALLCRGFKLETAADVKQFYEEYWVQNPSIANRTCPEYLLACSKDDDALCCDPGLPDRLFRGKRISDGTRIVIKAVSLDSREVDVTRRLSSPMLRKDSRNHCIPILDIVSLPERRLCFIVMEEWSSEFIPGRPCCLRLFLRALRSCIIHVTFMHEHRIAHLDLSLRNLVTDYKGHYACIDYELSRYYGIDEHATVSGLRGTEIPPELEHDDVGDPFKVDVWALGILILKAGHLTGHLLPELVAVIRPMLNKSPSKRPDMQTVLHAFDKTVQLIHPQLTRPCDFQSTVKHD